jgi:hypothetical protein
MDTIESLKQEIECLKKIIELYNISTKLDHQKIINLLDQIQTLKNMICSKSK